LGFYQPISILTASYFYQTKKEIQMTSISNTLSQFPDFHQLSSNTPFALKTQQFQAQAKTSTSTNLNFVTAEGDRVSLSAGSESHASFGTYTFQGLAEGQAVNLRSQESSTSIRSEFNLLIEGDLNEQEQADIQAFLQSAKNILQDVAAGNVEKATEAAISLSELDSLSSASLFFQKTTAVSLKFRSTQLAVQGDAHSNDSRRRGFDAGPGEDHKIDHIFDKIRKAQEKFQIDPEKLSKRLPTLLTKLVETLGKPFSKEESPQPLFEQIRKELFPSLLQATRSLKSEQETPEEVAEEVDNFTPPPTVKNGEILANLLNESEES
jgi:hypothetical protein